MRSSLAQSGRAADECLDKSTLCPDPGALAQEIVEDVEAALEQFREIAADLVGTIERENKLQRLPTS